MSSNFAKFAPSEEFRRVWGVLANAGCELVGGRRFFEGCICWKGRGRGALWMLGFLSEIFGTLLLEWCEWLACSHIYKLLADGRKRFY